VWFPAGRASQSEFVREELRAKIIYRMSEGKLKQRRKSGGGEKGKSPWERRNRTESKTGGIKIQLDPVGWGGLETTSVHAGHRGSFTHRKKTKRNRSRSITEIVDLLGRLAVKHLGGENLRSRLKRGRI